MAIYLQSSDAGLLVWANNFYGFIEAGSHMPPQAESS